MSQSPSPFQKRADLEERTMRFARDVRSYLQKAPESGSAFEDTMQLMHASAAVGASYIEANEAPGKKEFLLQVRMCLKEAKQSVFWLKMLDTPKKGELASELERLQQEALELFRIFCAITSKVRKNAKTEAVA
jgi:four helix bundle protein